MAAPHRLLILVPVGAKLAAVVAWFQANIGANAVDALLGPALCAAGDGTLTPTFRWCCGGFADAEAKAILTKLCQLAGVAVPTLAQWDNATQAQKRAWWLSVRDAVWTNYGAWCSLVDN